MTQLEKEAKEIVDKYDSNLWLGLYNSKQCALMEVDAIIKVLFSLKFGNVISEEIEHYEKLKQEIEKL